MQIEIQGYRLSPQQKRLWALQHGGGASYAARLAILLEGELRADILKDALQRIVGSHEILRTVFHRAPGMIFPIQVVLAESTPSWREVNLNGYGAEEEARLVDGLFREAASALFDMSDGPLVHATLVALAPRKHFLLLSLPSLCSDTHTLGNLTQEIGRAYAALLGRGEFAGEPAQYVQFSDYQNELLEAEADGEWGDVSSEQKGSDAPQLELPLERKDTRAGEFLPEILTYPLTTPVIENVESCASRFGVTTSTFLLACWQTLCWRLTRTPEVVVWCVLDGREYEELQEAFGLYASAVPVSCKFWEDITFAEVVSTAREALREAEERQAYFNAGLGGDVLAEGTDAPRRIQFEYTEQPPGHAAAGLTFSITRQCAYVDRFKLKLFCLSNSGSQHVEFHYDPAVYTQGYIERVASMFLTLLERGALDPGAAAADLDILSDAVRRQLLFEWNDTARAYRKDDCFHRLFEEQAARTPDRVAVVCGERRLTYSELNARANQLARHLRRVGAGPEVRVGVYMERSVEMLIALLGVLKAGGAYVPLDAGYPAERFAYVMRDGAAAVLLTQSSLLSALPEHGARVVTLDTSWGDIAAESQDNLTYTPDPENLAYVMYTSGSTGRPKGVMINQKGLSNYLSWCAQAYSVAEGSGVPVHSSMAFDLTVTSLFSPLIVGQTVFLLPEGHEAEQLGATLREGGNFSLVKITPAHLRVLSANLSADEIAGRTRALVIGGETLTGDSLSSWREHAPRTRIINEYGPTETVVGCCIYEISPDDPMFDVVPIGRPIANTRIYLLDPRKNPVPVGATAELFIGGVGVARGYLNRPELTAERFLPDPYSGEAGARLYRTGDLARYLPGGELEFLGRVDAQVKVRGYRIELGEVEAALLRHEEVSECVVAAREDEGSGGGKRLVAYVVGRDGTEAGPSAAELREHLRRSLPEYMVPAQFVTLASLPLTPNGKVDRKALPAPGQTRELGAAYQAPRTAVEEMLAGIWGELLGISEVGRNDNFFDLGGHSLLATQLVSRVRQWFGVEVALRTIFEQPTVAGLGVAIEAGRRSGAAMAAPALVRVEREGPQLVSFAQQRLWFLDQLEPDSALYNVPAVVRLRGALAVAALERSLSELVRRHEALRTRFVARDGEPLQVVGEAEGVALPVTDLSGIADEQEREAEAARRCTEEARRPFDLGRGPLLRATLLRLGAAEHLLLLTTHHIVSDGWSAGVMVDEVGRLYEAFSEGRESPLAELKVQYTDYAVWQREWLSGEFLAGELEYWRRELAGLAPVLELPTDRPRPAVQSYAGASASYELGEELSGRLRELARAEGVTLFMLLLAGFEALLWRYTGQERFAVGTPVANRTRAEVEGLIGFFVNTLALRADVSGDPTFGELLGRVREVCLGAYEHQEVAFERVVEELQPARSLSTTPLFQVMFAVQEWPVQAAQIKGLRVEAVDVESELTKFDLVLSAGDSLEGVSGSLGYNTDLFDATTIERILANWKTLLESAAGDPGQRLSELAVLGDDERRQILFEWNDTGSEYPNDCGVHELFERQVERTPDAVALIFEGEQLTYAGLNDRANRLAHELRERGVGPEVRVGLLLERSAAMVIGVLGVLKAGGAYVPLDPAFPAERLQFMAADAGLQILVTQQSLSELAAAGEATVVLIDGAQGEIEAQGTDNPLSNVLGDNLIYVIYTSGSTGKAKGVSITHRAVVNFLESMRRQPGLTPDDVLLSPTTLSFDISALELLLPLTVGARLIVASREVASDGQLLQERLMASRATAMQATPATWRMLLEAGWGGNERLKILCGGEALSQDLSAKLLACSTSCWNLYGPTETTIWSTVWQIEEGDDLITIGRPIANTRIYLLDPRKNPVPVGVTAELFIGGVGVARGYLNRPGLTAERFLPDPYSGEAGARLYRTGDLARYLPGGELEFLGRVDAQVKVRGYRIELGEVEAALLRHEEVSECVVAAREDEGSGGGKRLVAYVVGRDGTEAGPSAAELREHLRRSLPEYMVPAQFVTLASLPLTPNGKVDRKALPAPGQTRELGAAYQAPRTAVEEMLAGIWAELLGVSEVGRQENFFDLGGHSLLATQLVWRVRQWFGVEVALRTIFEQPTVAGLGVAIEAAGRGETAVAPPALVRVEREGPQPVSFAQQRLWFLDRLEPGSTAYVLAFAVRLVGQLDVEGLRRALAELVRRHEALRTTFAEVEGEPVQVVSLHGGMDFSFDDLTVVAHERNLAFERLKLEAVKLPFDLTTGPLLRCRLMKLSEQEHVALVTMHHIISDGWSTGIIMREVSTIYEAFSRGEESPLPELTVQYADYAVWQREWLQGEVLERQLEYWRKQLEALPPGLELPTDKPRPKEPTGVGDQHYFTVGSQLSRQLREVGREEGATLFMVLLAGFVTLLWRYTGQRDLAVGTPVANRTRGEIEGLIGFFVNTLVLRVRMGGGVTFRELLKRVKEVCLGAYAHQEVPFERVVEELQPERELGRTPLFQVLFALQNAGAAADGGDAIESTEFATGLRASHVGLTGGAVQFELSVTMSEGLDGLSGMMEYSTELFEEETVAQMARHYLRLLEGAVENPQSEVWRLPLLDEEEQREILDMSGETPAEEVGATGAVSVHELFGQRARERPEAIAVVDGPLQLTYADLNLRANRLVPTLERLGVSRGTLVGVCLKRCADQIVSILAALKAGAAYLPLSSELPALRLKTMLRVARPQVVLTRGDDGALAAICANDDMDVRVVDVEEALEAASSGSLELVEKKAISGKELAYVIFTSGSTGEPKGVAVTHGGLASYVEEAVAKCGMHVGERVLQFTPLSFDIAAEEIWMSLCSGATLVLRSDTMIGSASAFLRQCQEWRLTVIDLPTAYWHELVSQTSSEQWAELESLGTVIIGGEAALPDHVTRWRELTGGRVRLINTYGPTETTIVATWCDLTEWEPGAQRSVSIGRPIRKVQTYVLDEYMMPVPVGVSGELYIGGSGLARGYLKRPELTAQSFVPNPLGGRHGARLYRTGDVGRYRRDGQLEFLGRVDSQVKVRGYRIEPEEIEVVLRGYEGIRAAVVVERGESSGNKRLAAYVVGDEAAEQSAANGQLRSYLKARLPAYMIPATLTVLKALPLTPNGKVDRKALPAPGQTRELGAAYQAPRTAVEEMLAGIWGELLGVSEVGRNDNFFELGGHSLLATQLVSRVRQWFGVEVALRTIFEQPTVAGLGVAIEAGRRGGAAMAAPALVRVEREGPQPVSFAQQRLWFLDQLEPDSALYNVPAAVRLRGALAVAALERSLSELVRRHEALRTRFVARDGEPLQVVGEAEGVALPVTDLSGIADEQEREAEAARRCTEEARRPFDLGRGPLLRATLLRLGAAEHLLLLTTHHIVSDGWSAGVMVDEVGRLYEAFSEGRESPLAELKVQYTDYAVWQREWLSGEFLAGELEYWRRELAGLAPVLELPTDRLRPAVSSHRGAAESTLLGEELSGRLRELARAEGVTLFMLLLAGFEALLWRYTGQERFAVGTPVANRTRAEVEGLIGFFVNTLALRADVSGDPTFHELLGRVREITLGAYEHQEVAFERVVEELQPARSLSTTPLFQVMFAVQEWPVQAAQIKGLRVEAVESASGVAKFDLSLEVNAAGGELEVRVEYARELFEEETIRRMLGHYAQLLEGAIQAPGTRLSELPLLNEEEGQLLYEWNNTRTEYPQKGCVHELFEQQVKATASHQALILRDERLTYQALNERANRLAHYLHRLGVRAETRVGVLLERSAGMVAALLGVLKAGGVYVPLEATHPQERLEFMAADAGLKVLVTQQSLGLGMPTGDFKVIYLDTDGPQIERESTAKPANEVGEQNGAYLIYTSGSTGNPKAVVVEHRSLTNVLLNAKDKFNFTGLDVFPCLASFAFDISLFELLTPLLCGGTARVLSEEEILDLNQLVMVLDEVTVLHAVPSLMAQLLARLEERAAAGEARPRLRAVFVGGEAVPAALLERIRAAFPGAMVQVLYGPTEAAIICASYAPGPGDEQPEQAIGRPLPNAQLRVQGVGGQLSPVGVSGELYIGGVGVARGYLNRPELTAERFLPDPYSGEAGARLYRTGDLARYLPGGELEFLGRVDAQVKVRGYRIELGEVEAALLRHEEVSECVVAAREDEGSGGGKRLVAYVVGRDGTEAGPSAAELREHLRRSLPEYMVPAQFVTLASLPLTPNGKVDRKALPAPGQTRELGAAYQAPRTAVEEMLAGIWGELLGVSEVGRQENFFELGGHSLLATQLVSRVRQWFGVEVALRTIFEQPTVAGLGVAIEAGRRSGAAMAAPALVRVEREGPQPVSFAQQRLWFLDQLEPDSALYNMPAAVRLSGALAVAALERSLSELVRRHEALRTRFVARDGEPLQVVGEAEGVALPVTDLSGIADEQEREAEAARRCTEEARRPFDLGRGPLLRATLLRLGAAEHLLLLTTHHIVSDGWSAGVMVDEVGRLYEAFSEGRESPLAELKVQYTDYAVWQREWLSGEFLAGELEYWRRELAGLAPVLELPTDRLRPAVSSHRGAAESTLLGEELSGRLRELARAEGVTLFMLLLAGFKALLWRYTGQTEVVVGTDVAGRTREEVEGLIGFFVNQLVLRTHLSGELTSRELLGRVREVCLGAYQHQEVPFERVVDELQPARQLNRNPLFQVKFTLQGAPLQDVAMGNLEISQMLLKEETAKFDLALGVVDKGANLVCTLDFDADLFNATTARRMLELYETLLLKVVEQPELKLATLRTMLDEEYARRLSLAEKSYESTSLHKLRNIRRKSVAARVGYGDE